MPRKYRLGRRAELQVETRQRIVEAAVALHSERGPARTTMSAVAERAGVQRHTLYRHFPSEVELLDACSGLHLSRHPLPDPDALGGIPDAERRLRRALDELFAYYDAHASLLDHVFHDAEHHQVTAAVVHEKIAPTFARMHQVVVEGYGRGASLPAVHGAIDLALDFRTWDLLVRRRALTSQAAIDLLAAFVAAAANLESAPAPPR